MFFAVVRRLVLIFGLELGFERLKVLFPRFSPKIRPLHYLRYSPIEKDALARPMAFWLPPSGVLSAAAFLASVSAISLPVGLWCLGTAGGWYFSTQQQTHHHDRNYKWVHTVMGVKARSWGGRPFADVQTAALQTPLIEFPTRIVGAQPAHRRVIKQGVNIAPTRVGNTLSMRE